MVTNLRAFNSDVPDSKKAPAQSGLPRLEKQPLDADELFDLRRVDSLRFLVQTGLSIAIMALCIGKLAFMGSEANNDKALFWGGITSIVTWWMPSPGASRGLAKAEKAEKENQE